MFKKLVSILLLLALISSNFSSYIVLAGFQLNRQYIADKLCENRTRPQFHCMGKCYLAKNLKQADDTQKKQVEKNELKNIEICQSIKSLQLSFAIPASQAAASKPSTLYRFSYVSHHISSIFRPPRIIA